MNSCLLQFPFGVGGPDELWKKPDGSFVTSSIDMGKYVEHLSRLSIKYFQKEIFTLQLYNIIMKQWMLRSATFRLRNKTTVDKFANNLSEEDIRDVLQRKKKNQSSFTGSFPYSPATQFISAIDAITAYLPHTNATAKKTIILQSVCSIMGIPTFFVTISPDDENTWISRYGVENKLTTILVLIRMTI